MTKKQINDAAAYIRGLAQTRGRNAAWAERAVREAVSLSAAEAERERVIDFVARDLDELLAKSNGRKVTVRGQAIKLAVAGASVETILPDWRSKLLATITNPSFALILMMLGIYGIWFEFSNPGFVFPGVIGAICLLLAMFAFQMLPVNYVGLALIVLGLAFMVAEVFFPSFGSLGIGGLIAFVVGAIFLMDTEVPGYGIPIPLIAGLALASAAFMILVGGMAAKARAAARGHRARGARRRGRGGDRDRGRRELGARARRDVAHPQPRAPRPRPPGARHRCRRPDPRREARRRRRVKMFLPDLNYALLVVVFAAGAYVLSSLRILREYERGVTFMLGRFWKVKGPGLVVVVRGVQQMVKVDLRVIVLDVPPQDVITRDNVSVKVNAVVYFRAVDAQKAIIQVENFLAATSQLAQTTLRAVLGKHELDELLSEREKLNLDIQRILDSQTDAWGIKVTNVEIKHVDLNETMVRAIARQAEAERERRAKVIHAEGELQASVKLLEAAQMLAQAPQAMQLRYLQTLTQIAGDRSSTIVFPVPMDIFRTVIGRSTEGG